MLLNFKETFTDGQKDMQSSSFTLLKNSNVLHKLAFMKQHPIQPSFSNSHLHIQKLYKRKMPDGKEVSRNWLSVHVENNELKSVYCPICIAFSSHQSPFINGYKDFKHIHIAVKKHEESRSHNFAVQNYIQASSEQCIEFKVNRNLLNLKRIQVQENIHVVEQIFDIIKFLGKQSLPFRGSGSSEGLYQLGRIGNHHLNNGNFLELVQFTAKRDSILQKHLTLAIKNSEKRKLSLKNKSKGRGSLVTLLSKTTINKIIIAILQSIRNKIKNELCNQKFSLQVDSTQDVSVSDQAAIYIRYIYNGEITERLFAVLKIIDSSGEGYYEMLKNLFLKHNINFKNVIGESFDGASNMRGAFSGLQSRIKHENPKSIYIWCYSHILNLCISDACKHIDAKNLFGFLNRLSTFFGDSYKRMNVWIEQNNTINERVSLKKLQKVGENNTRWWSREKSLFWVFEGKQCLFLTVISALNFVMQSPDFDSKTCSEASSLIEKLCSFKLILTAHIFMNIFQIIGPTSRYLQTKNMDLLTAWDMVEVTKSEITKLKFETIYKESQEFIKQMNEKLCTLNFPDEINISNTFPTSRISKKKSFFDEQCSDEVLSVPIDKFRVGTFVEIKDQIISSLNQRFSANSQLIADIQYFIPKNFDLVASMPNIALTYLSEVSNIPKDKLHSELKSFVAVFPKISTSIKERTQTMYQEQYVSEDNDNNEESINEFSDILEDNTLELIGMFINNLKIFS